MIYFLQSCGDSVIEEKSACIFMMYSKNLPVERHLTAQKHLLVV